MLFPDDYFKAVFPDVGPVQILLENSYFQGSPYPHLYPYNMCIAIISGRNTDTRSRLYEG